jgi:hypothetical protein
MFIEGDAAEVVEKGQQNSTFRKLKSLYLTMG